MDYDHSGQIVIWETVLAKKKKNYMGNGTHGSNRLEMDPKIHCAIAFDM